MVRHNNYWFNTCPTRRDVSPGLIKNVDVLIIGGGLSGISVLCQLIKAGINNIYLLEESTVGYRASGRGSGQLMLRGGQLFSEMNEADGVEYLKFILENNRNFVKGFRKVRFDTDLREVGGLRLAVDEDELSVLKKEADFIRKHTGIECPILEGNDLRGVVPTESFEGGMFMPNDAIFNPYKIVNGCRETIELKGRRVLIDAQVESIEQKKDDGFSVRIRHKGTIRAKQIVYCNNACVTELVPELSDCLKSFRSQITATDFLKSSASQLIPAMSMSCHNDDTYFRLHGGRLLIGGMRSKIRGKQEGINADGEISAAVHEKLCTFIREVLPCLKDTKFTHAWSSTMCTTSDNLPLIGPIPGRPSQYVMTGFGDYGYSHILGGSSIIKDYILYDGCSNPITSLFNPSRFKG
jgi:glycine/D-amino acid oxidase-like deaminating enzyme